MKPSVWSYYDSNEKVTCFRGRVLKYTGNLVESIACPQVRKNRLKAIEDAKRKMRELRTVVQ